MGATYCRLCIERMTLLVWLNDSVPEGDSGESWEMQRWLVLQMKPHLHDRH